MLFVFVYVYRCPTRFPYQMMPRFLSFNIITTDVTSGAGTTCFSRVAEFTTVFCGNRVALSLVFCVVICRLLFVLFCPLSFVHCIICSSSNYDFWLLLWYLQQNTNMCSQKFYIWYILDTLLISALIIEYRKFTKKKKNK